MYEKSSGGSVTETESLLQPVVPENDGARAFIMRFRAAMSTNSGMTIQIAYYFSVVSINTFSVIYGASNREHLHLWWMVCLELLLALMLGLEVGGKYLYHLLVVTAEEKGASFWSWEHIFDAAVCFLSFVSCILVVVQNNNTEDAEDVGYTTCRVIRDVVSIVRTFVFMRTMLKLQVEFCCDDKDDDTLTLDSPKPGDSTAANSSEGPPPLSPPLWAQSNLDSPVPGMDTPTNQNSSPSPSMPPLCLDSGNSNTANFKKLERERTLL